MKYEGYIAYDTHSFNILFASREIFLHSYMDIAEDEDPGIEYKSANVFLKNIRILENDSVAKPIVIHQHSIGGNWSEGIMMYDIIKTCSAPVVLVTHGVAASMGSLIPQAADLRISMPSCAWMLHEGSSATEAGTFKQTKSWHAWEEDLCKRMLDIYVDVCAESAFFKDRTAPQIRGYIQRKFNHKEDWILEATEAVKYGLCDGIYGEQPYTSLASIISHVS